MSGYIEGGKYHAVSYHEMCCYLSGRYPDGEPFFYDLKEFVKRHRDLAYAVRAARSDRRFGKVLRVARKIDRMISSIWYKIERSWYNFGLTIR